MKRLAVALVLLLAGCSGPEPISDPTEGLPEPPAWLCDLCGVLTSDRRASEPAIAMHADDPDRIAVAAIEGDGVFVQGVGQAPAQTPGWAALSVRTTTDGGTTWQDAAIPYAGRAPPQSGWSRYCVTADPVLEAVGDELRLYGLGWPCTQGVLPSATSVGSIWMSVSADWGATWSEPRTVVESPGAVEWPDKAWAATDPRDPKRIVATWLGIEKVGAGRFLLRVAHSLDGGATWSEPATVTDSDAEGGKGTFSSVAAWGPDQRAHIAFRGCGGTCLKVASSTDLAAWTAVKVADVERVAREGGRAIGNWHPSLAATPSGLAVAWHGEGPDGSADAFVARETGGKWSSPLRIPGLAGEGQDQWWPFVAASGDTVVGILYDRSGDPDNLATRAVAWRLDGAAVQMAPAGAAWNVSESSFAFYGDYIGASAGGAAFAAAWGQVSEDGFRRIHAARFALAVE